MQQKWGTQGLALIPRSGPRNKNAQRSLHSISQLMQNRVYDGFCVPTSAVGGGTGHAGLVCQTLGFFCYPTQ
jgi:hypothetical protein